MVPSIQSLVADSTDDGTRGSAFGWLQLASSLSQVQSCRIEAYIQIEQCCVTQAQVQELEHARAVNSSEAMSTPSSRPWWCRHWRGGLLHATPSSIQFMAPALDDDIRDSRQALQV